MIQNIATQKMIQALKEQIMKEQFDEKYPVGNGHYIQFQGMAEPSVAFAKYGATWQIDTDYTGRVLVGSGTGFTLGATGGEKEHTLIDAEIPHYEGESLMHGFAEGSTIQTVSGVFNGIYEVKNRYRDAPSVDFQGTQSYAGIRLYFGGGQPHNNMQPYKVVAVWKRTA